jgi:hypothetical protein
MVMALLQEGMVERPWTRSIGNGLLQRRSNWAFLYKVFKSVFKREYFHEKTEKLKV